MLRENFIRKKLATGNPVLGTWVTIPSLTVVDIIAHAGMDFVVLDAEHGPLNFETAQMMMAVCEAHQVSPVMRVSGVVGSEISKALDMGAHGVQVPNVASREEAAQAISFAHYAPLGVRGFSPFTRAGGYSAADAARLPQRANENTLLAIHIEGKEGLKNMDEIVALSDLDIIFIGAFDLSHSLGVPGDIMHPKVIRAVKEISNKSKNQGKVVGTIAHTKEQAQIFLACGVQYLTYAVDCDILTHSYQKMAEEFKQWI